MTDACYCSSLSDLAAVPMGGDGMDERVFATIERVRDYGGDAWWLHASKCNACGQDWMVAQEERVFDEYFLQRLTANQAADTADGRWPDDFITYERVLKIGRAMSSPCIFLDPLDSSLVWTAHDLKKERPDIAVEQIADLIGVSPKIAKRLLAITP